MINLSGVRLDPRISAVEIRRRLETTSLFTRVQVRETSSGYDIVVNEKTNWFVLPYFASETAATIYGVAAGKASFFGDNGTLLGRYQRGTDDQEANLVFRDEYFLNSLFALGGSLDYEDSRHRIFAGRDVVQRTANLGYGGSIQSSYHFTPYFVFGLNTYIEQHRFAEPDGTVVDGFQLSHRLLADYGNFYVNEGLSRGASGRFYVETASPASDFEFNKFGLSGQASVLLRGKFNWITRARYESGTDLPRYQLFELGGGKLRSFPVQGFRDSAYFSAQNDFLLMEAGVWKFKLRPLVYLDWAWIQRSGRTGVGAGLQVYLPAVAVPALQVFAGYGFNPDGFGMSIALGPQF